MKFAWHQDGGYVKFSDPKTRHRPYLTCWCALDDMSEDNGTIFVMPHDRANTRNHILPHRARCGNMWLRVLARSWGMTKMVPLSSLMSSSAHQQVR